MTVSSKWWRTLLFVFIVLVALMGCKPDSPPNKAPQSGAQLSPIQTPIPAATGPVPGQPLPTVVLTDWAPGTPIVLQEGKDVHLPTVTPWPTFTPRPTPTRRPGPTATAFPIRKPASSAAGTILFGSFDPKTLSKAVMAMPTNGQGQKTAEAASIPLSLDFTPILDSPSPDGRYLLLSQPVEPEGIPYVLNWQTQQLWPLLKGHPMQEHIIGRLYGWHPDSRQVLFWFFNNEELWLIDAETGAYTVLALTNGPVQGAAISPDGQKVVYVDRSAVGHATMFVVSASGGDAQPLIDSGMLYLFGWSPDGQHILYAGEPSAGKAELASGLPAPGGPLWIMDAEGNKRQPLVSPFIFGWGFEPVWSPDGRWVASTGLDAGQKYGCAQKEQGSTVDPDTCRFEGTAIYVENVLTGEVRRLASGIDPAWSPDGSTIAFLSNQSGTPQIWTVRADGTDLRQITADAQSKNRIVWMPDRR